MRRVLTALLTATAAASWFATSTSASGSVPTIPATAFGMHALNPSHAYPPLSFGTARIWDMGVTWADLQPDPPPSLLPVVDTNQLPVVAQPAPWSSAAVSRLDGIVKRFSDHHVQPLLTLGMTPAWDANTTSTCHHVDATGHDWGLVTCAPKDDVSSDTGTWATYVDYLAHRYQGKIRYFELWNEPSLANGWNDSVTTLAAMQAEAQKIVHKYGAQLVSPGVAFTNGSPTNGYNWLRSFLAQPGGWSYDITGLHLYPADAPVRSGVGPEWVVQTALPYARSALTAAGVATRPIWDTEHNVGRTPAHTGYRESAAGAAAVAKTYVLAAENRIARTIWYAADDRGWGGTWLERSDYASRSTAGNGYQTARNLIVGKAPLGCSKPRGSGRGAWTCRFGSSSGHRTLIVAWTTGKPFTWHAPRGTKTLYAATGSRSSHRTFTLGNAPVFAVGSF